MAHAREYNFDGLVGPTHNYAGLSPGNVASATNVGTHSSPKQAALQGLQKAKHLADMGYPQGVLPPIPRPELAMLRAVGFDGDDASVLKRASEETPQLFAAAWSASSMWAANAATVSPSPDTRDGRVHFTPANLIANVHRAQESGPVTRALRAIFANTDRFMVHDPLPGVDALSDEGAANHTRFCNGFGDEGVNLFVYGRDPLDKAAISPARFPARQTLPACQAIARRHGLSPDKVVFAQQRPDVIDAGIFHNDVIAVGHRLCLLTHERAWLSQDGVIARIQKALGRDELRVVTVPDASVAVEEAVRTYLFNAQLLTMPREDDPSTCFWFGPSQCDESPTVSAWLRTAVGSTAIGKAETIDVRESMRNGGGPACLRLRMVLTDDEASSLSGRVLLDDALYADLVAWVEQHYRDELKPSDLLDPQLAEEARGARIALAEILALPALAQDVLETRSF